MPHPPSPPFIPADIKLDETEGKLRLEEQKGSPKSS